MRVVLWILSIVFLVLLIGKLLFTVSEKAYGDNARFTNGTEFNSGAGILDLSSRLSLVPDAAVADSFPVQEYLASDNWKTMAMIGSDLATIDSIAGAPGKSMELLMEVLTNRWNPYTTSSLDTLNMVFNWALQFKSDCSQDYMMKIFFKSLYNDAMPKISTRLDSLQMENPSIAYGFKFRFLRAKLSEQQVTSGVKTDNLTKTIHYVIDRKWAYLWHKFWDDTSFMYKLFLLIPVTITLYAYSLLIKKIIPERKKAT